MSNNPNAYTWNLKECTLGLIYSGIQCEAPIAKYLVTEDKQYAGCACALHAMWLDGEQHSGTVSWRLEKGMKSKVSTAPLNCELCGELFIVNLGYQIIRYEGPICAQCRRAGVTTDAVKRQTDSLMTLIDLVKESFPAKPVVDLFGTKEKQSMPASPVKSLVDKVRSLDSVKTLEADAAEAAWRMAGSQFVKLTKEPVVALLSRHLGPDDESLRARIAAFLGTEIGTAILAGVLSAGLSAMPIQANDVSQRLARELRLKSMATAGDAFADILLGPLREVAVAYLSASPVPSAPIALLGERTMPEKAPVREAEPVAETPRSVWAGA